MISSVGPGTPDIRFGMRFPWSRRKKALVNPTIADLESGKAKASDAKPMYNPKPSKFWPRTFLLSMGALAGLTTHWAISSNQEAEIKNKVLKDDFERRFSVNRHEKMPGTKPGESLPSVDGLTYLTPKELQDEIEKGNVQAIEPFNN